LFGACFGSWSGRTGCKKTKRVKGQIKHREKGRDIAPFRTKKKRGSIVVCDVKEKMLPTSLKGKDQ